MLQCKTIDYYFLTKFIYGIDKKLDVKKVKGTSKLWQNKVQPIAACKENVSSYNPVTLKKLNCYCLAYNKHLVNQA